MKKMRKLLALLLALAMACCLVACGVYNKGSMKETDAEKVLGEWVYRLDFSDAVSEILAGSLGDASLVPATSIYIDLTLNFGDGEFTMVQV